MDYKLGTSSSPPASTAEQSAVSLKNVEKKKKNLEAIKSPLRKNSNFGLTPRKKGTFGILELCPSIIIITTQVTKK